MIGLLKGRVEATHEGGDHTIIIGRVVRFQAGEGEPLTFFRGGYGRITALD